MIGNILDWVKNHKITVGIIVGLFSLIMFFRWANNYMANKEAREAAKTSQVEEVSIYDTIEETSTIVEGTDEYLMQQQEKLRMRYGTSPKGFIWDLTGSLISLGDKSMSAEDVLYNYLRGISTLDMESGQKYSRSALVTQTYADFFDSKYKNNNDYSDSFSRSMYREALLSLEINGIETSSKFAENKIVYTVNVSMLDLTNKDFWLEDKNSLFLSMYEYDKNENDPTKLEIFLYDYILNYYKSEDAVKRSFTVDITLERYPDIDSGWLVSNDSDIENAAKYTDGNVVTKYITETYRNWATDVRSGLVDLDEIIKEVSSDKDEDTESSEKDEG